MFAVAGIAKLLDLAGSRRAMQGFGLPVAELLVAAALIPPATANWGAGATAILLTGFFGGIAVNLGGIAVNLRRGRAPDCHCFGQLHWEPVGTATLIRNGALLVLALLISGLAGTTRARAPSPGSALFRPASW